MTETITCTVLSTATIYTSTLPGGGVGVYVAEFSFGDIAIVVSVLLLVFSIVVFNVSDRVRSSWKQL